MWGKTTQRIPSNSAYQFLLEPGGGKEKKKGGGKKSRGVGGSDYPANRPSK